MVWNVFLQQAQERFIVVAYEIVVSEEELTTLFWFGCSSALSVWEERMGAAT